MAPMPTEEKARFLVLKVLEQTVRDYESLSNSTVSSEQAVWETARSFLFDDDHFLMWGDWELTTEDLLDMVDLDIHWVRQQVNKKSKG